jgi:hypothetical protein
VPFAIAISMLTPFALWLGLRLFGQGDGMVRFEDRLGAVLLAASLPLAGLFRIQTLRRRGDLIGAASRLGVVASLTAPIAAARPGEATIPQPKT